MYKNFFGFKERPFQLVPNPAYLFLSRSHEEAMAHLTYALSQGDGFVEMTGEVGTGKTTLCRAFLENLDQNTEAAYIFNPKLDSLQLLKTINDEFGIFYEEDNIKDLIDRLNAFLLRKKTEGKKVILVIDEAQSLSTDVLEQLRLLSNLETTTSKLLQIVLVGQPELGEMLDSPELRQLGQRITLSCHLSPLSFKETKDYIRHRLHVASQQPGVHFTWPVLRALYRYSGGIPRLINIACDRALLTAFGLDQKRVTANIARASILELAGRGDIKRIGLWQGRKGLQYVALLLVCLILIVFYRPGEVNMGTLFRTTEKEGVAGKKEQKAEIKESPKPAAREQTPQAQVESPPPVPKEVSPQNTIDPAPVDVADLGSLLEGTTGRSSRSPAIRAAIGSWVSDVGINPYLEGLEDDQVFFRLAAKQNGLLLYRHEGEWDVLEKLDLPAVLEFRLQGSQGPRYLTLRHVDEEGVTLAGMEEGKAVRVRLDQLRAYWAKVAYIPWKDFLDYPGVIHFNAPKESIITLKILLQDIGFTDMDITPLYDERTRDAVKTVQQKHGIRVDGIVGPLTKMVLYKERKAVKIPSLVETKKAQGKGELTP